MKMVPKTLCFQISSQFSIGLIKSLIEILILTINSIASLSNSNVNLKFAALFSLIIGFEFMHFDHQLINKLLISLIWPLIWSISAPIFIRLFPVWSLILDFFNQVPNYPSNFNIYAIKPLI